jgi:hypothetical protein
MRKHLIAIALIITGASGCDNVGWGGMDFEVRPPPEPEVEAAIEADPETTVEPERVEGPILLAGLRDGERADMVVVGEIRADALRHFPDPEFPEDVERLDALTAPGAEWVLFSEGVRIGRFIVERSGPADGFCGGRLALSGVVELVPSATGAERLLALPPDPAAARGREPYEEHQHVYDQRVASLSIASEAIPRYGATWPELGVLDARDHIQAFQLRNTQGQSIAATFMSGDELAVGPPPQDAYSLFIVGQQREGAEYAEAYSWYQDSGASGKAAPRYFDHLDLDDDGMDEIVLDVFGANARWFAGLSRRDGQWVRTFNDRCGAPAG